MPKIYLVEDNFLHREYLFNQITKALNQKKIFFDLVPVTNIPTFVRSLSKKTISDTDIFFLDIDLTSFLDGVQIGEIIRGYNANCFLIFVTAELNKGVDILNLRINPFAYIIKENNSITTVYSQLLQTFDDIVANLNPVSDDKNISVTSRGQMYIFKESDINYIQTIEGNRYSTLFKLINDEIVLGSTISKLKKSLDSTNLFTGLKSTIINVSNIQEIYRKESLIIFKNEDSLVLTPRLIDKVQSFITNRKFS
ncbi:TPA: LytTR family transcriptional regulator DNA-binding domain-containing protein [Listeria monocytogenes]|nr:LytTR family transcriptional regulator DNA-binding domain-containing protein [Listeria monocytogenes]